MTENNTTAQDFKGSKNRHWLIVRPDGYGDIVLFEPAIRHLRQVYPNDKITILVRNDRIDVRHLFMPGIEWIGFDGDPFGQNIFENGDYIETLKQKLISLAPDVIIAPRFDKTWVEAVAALSCRRARRISMGSSKYDIRTEIWIKNNSVSPPELYPELANEILREDQELVKNSKLALYVTQTPLAVTAPKLTFPKGTTEDVENFIQKNQITKKNTLFVFQVELDQVKDGI